MLQNKRLRKICPSVSGRLLELARQLGFCDRRTFEQLLRHEERRSRRSNRPFTLVEIRLGLPRTETGARAAPLEKQWDCALRSIGNSCRETDPRFFDGEAVLILLPDTSQGRAGVVGNRLLDSIRTRLGGLAGGECEEAVATVDVRGYHRSSDSPPASGSDAKRSGRWQHPLAELGSRGHGFARAAKRLLDIVGASAGILLCLPLALFIAAGIKLTSPGPVVFRQQRFGLRRRPFTLLKFRTMRTDCDDRLHRQYVERLISGRDAGVNLGSAERPLFKLKEDPRITALGAFLRRWSLDELPQLLNVLAGDMSLVGPRPPVSYELENYQPWHFERLQAKPGITGLWQVKGRSRTTFDDMVRMDLRYIRQWSLLLDLLILVETFPVVLGREGAA